MARTVIRLEGLVNGDGNTLVQLRPEEPIDVKSYGSPSVLPCRVDVAPFVELSNVLPGAKGALPGELVRKVGQELFQGLAAHDGVLEALDRATSTTAVSATHPIYVASDVLDAEALPFEVLYHPKAEFLGLDSRWPIVWMVGRQKGLIQRFLRLPVRLAAILSAADRDAISEWQALRDAVLASNLHVQVTVYAGRDDLAAHVAAQQDPWVALERVPPTADAVVEALTRLRPHLLHVFSHGSSQYQGFLEIATRGTFTFGDPPVYLTAKDLARVGGDLWLATLNACEGAAPATALHSVAYAMVEEGVPATIGMREVIDAADASQFCRTFYRSALAQLAAAITPGARIEPDWCEPLRLARRTLCGNGAPVSIAAQSSKPWTLPVLYQRAEEFVVQAADPALSISDVAQEQLFSELDKLRRLREGLAPDTPPPVVAAYDAAIAAVRARLV